MSPDRQLRRRNDGTLVTEQSAPPPGANRPADPAARRVLAPALRRARWTIFWERLWPALAALATTIGIFLALSWLGLWLWLSPLGRTVGLIGFAALALVALWPFVGLRLPGTGDALRRLDRGSGLRHRPATAISDALAVS